MHRIGALKYIFKKIMQRIVLYAVIYNNKYIWMSLLNSLLIFSYE